MPLLECGVPTGQASTPGMPALAALTAKTELIERLTYREVITRDIGVMDHTAITMCHEARIPIIVFDMLDKRNVLNVISHDRDVGTLIAHND